MYRCTASLATVSPMRCGFRRTAQSNGRNAAARLRPGGIPARPPHSRPTPLSHERRQEILPFILQGRPHRSARRLLSNLDEFGRTAGADLAAELQAEMRGLVETYEALKS